MINRIIDAHCLVGRDYWLSINKPHLSHENLLSFYEKDIRSVSKLYKAAIMPFPSSSDGSYVEENELILSLSRKKPWTIPVLAFNPKSDANYNYVRRQLDSGTVGALVIWPILCNLDLINLIDNHYFRNIAENYSCCITVHVGAGNEQRIGRVESLLRYDPDSAVLLAASYPNTCFNLSHLLRISERALHAVEQLSNVIIDTSGISAHGRWYEAGSNVFPAEDCIKLRDCKPEAVIKTLMDNPLLADKLAFGTQYPFGMWYRFGLKEEVELLMKAGLDELQLDKLFYCNFNRFMGDELKW